MHLIYFRFYFPLPGEPGPRRQLDIVQRYRDQGHSVSVVTSKGNSMTGESAGGSNRLIDKSEKDGITFYRVHALKDYRRSMKRRILNYLIFMVLSFWAGIKAKAKPGQKNIILVSISPPFTAFSAYLLSLVKPRASLVLEITDLPESAFQVNLFNRTMYRKTIDIVFRHMYRKADHIVTLTPGAKRHIQKTGIDEKKITVVTNWANPEATDHVSKEAVADIRKKYGWDGKFVVLYAGVHGQAHDLMTLIRAGEKLRDRDDLRIVFVGEGERKKEYIEYCKSRDLDLFEFLPPVSRKELSSYLASVNVGTNLFHKGEFWGKVVGHKIFDYFASSCPIIFSGHGDTADIVLNAQGGRVVPPEDPEKLCQVIAEFMDNSDETTQMGQRGKAYMEMEFDREKMLSVLDSVLIS